jgi:hypothetical protein
MKKVIHSIVFMIEITVKPLYSGHPSDFSKVSTIERLGLFKSNVFTKSRRVF